MGHPSTCLLFRVRALPNQSFASWVHSKISETHQIIDLFRLDLNCHHTWYHDSCTVSITGISETYEPIIFSFIFHEQLPLFPQISQYQEFVNQLTHLARRIDNSSDSNSD